MPTALPPELYYLANFRTALAWVSERYGDLLSTEEIAFIRDFSALATRPQALLVRMIMRKGPHFRASKLSYAEIGELDGCVPELVALGWVSELAPLSITELGGLLRKDELLAHLPLTDCRRGAGKGELMAQLEERCLEPQSFQTWCPHIGDRLYSLTVGELCDRLRLMFFGNLSQNWSEFVLAELGIFRYEPVAITPDSRGFRSREDLQNYLFLREQRLRFDAGEPTEALLESLALLNTDNPYLQTRHAKLLFLIAQQLEKQHELEAALLLYQRSDYGDARWRQIRVLEKLERHAPAHDLALQIAATPRSDAEMQLVTRALVRLRRKLGLPAAGRSAPLAEQRLDLLLKRPEHGSVEHAVREHLHRDAAPAHYVENTLLCSLFGLVCWEAIFAPLPGAFFHPFHSGPVDLLSADFQPRREALFNACLERLDSPAYLAHVRQLYHEKFGTQSPFVFWNVLSEELLEQALHCIPAQHLKACFQRLLGDIKANRAGMPDLIQFFPDERRYRLIEVKGPGDRLQDNQKRWLTFCASQGIPVEVCYVSWSEA